MLLRMPAGIAGAAVLSALLLSGAADAREVRIASGHPGSPWHAFGTALAREYGMTVEGAAASDIGRGNGYWNPVAVHAWRADFGLSHAASAVWAYTGDDIAYEKKRYTRIRVLIAGLTPVWIVAMLREDYIRRTGLSTLARALREPQDAPRLVMAPSAGSVPVVADMILAAMGTTRRSLRGRGGDVLHVGPSQIPRMIRNGRADLWFAAAAPNRAAAFGAALAGHARFVELPPAARTALQRAGLAPAVLPPPPGSEGRPVRSVDLGTAILVHRDVENAVVRTMLAVLIDRWESLAASHPAWSGYNPVPGDALETRGVPMHPAAARFFRERGWTRTIRKGTQPPR